MGFGSGVATVGVTGCASGVATVGVTGCASGAVPSNADNSSRAAASLDATISGWSFRHSSKVTNGVCWRGDGGGRESDRDCMACNVSGACTSGATGVTGAETIVGAALISAAMGAKICSSAVTASASPASRTDSISPMIS